jgi:hypothetical protein
MGNPRMLVAMTLAAAVVIGVILSLSTDNWLFLVLAVGVHFAASAFVGLFIGKRLEQGDKPDPVTEAHVEAGDDVSGKQDGLTDSGRRDDREVIL